MEKIRYGILDSPVGPLTVVASPSGLQRLSFGAHILPEVTENLRHPVLREAAHQLEEYFAGCRKYFEIPLDMTGTPFQKSVWALLQRIPYGETTSYGELAKCLGGRNKSRAVGLANGANPVAIIVPCHRVIGASGALTGFSGGIDTKAFLLRLERGSTEPDLFTNGGATG